MVWEYGGKLKWLSWILWETFSLLHMFINFVLANDKGNKEWWKVEAKEKGKKKKKEIQEKPKVFVDIRQR